MKLKPPDNNSHPISNYHCGCCGSDIPKDRRYMFALYEQKVRNAEKYTQTAQFICPTCWTMTRIDYFTDASNEAFIRWMNLYTDTLEGNDDPEKSV